MRLIYLKTCVYLLHATRWLLEIIPKGTTLGHRIFLAVADFIDLYFNIYHPYSNNNDTSDLRTELGNRLRYLDFYYGQEYFDYSKSRREKLFFQDKTEKEWLLSEIKFIDEFLEKKTVETQNLWR